MHKHRLVIILWFKLLWDAHLGSIWKNKHKAEEHLGHLSQCICYNSLVIILCLDPRQHVLVRFNSARIAFSSTGWGVYKYFFAVVFSKSITKCGISKSWFQRKYLYIYESCVWYHFISIMYLKPYRSHATFEATNVNV